MRHRTEEAVKKMLAAIPSATYDLGIQDGSGPFQTIAGLSGDNVTKRAPYLKARNARSSNIYVRPTGSIRYTLLDDLSYTAVQKMSADGYAPCALVETSPNNFQAWLKHEAELPQELATESAKVLSRTYGADLNAAGWLRFGRLAGFTNRKPKHQQSNGYFPFVRLHDASGRVFSQAGAFHTKLLDFQADGNASQDAPRPPNHSSLSPQGGRRFSSLDVLRFRVLPKYTGRPAAADLAFARTAFAIGATEAQVEAALKHHYLSSDSNLQRRDQYVNRTIRKAVTGNAFSST